MILFEDVLPALAQHAPQLKKCIFDYDALYNYDGSEHAKITSLHNNCYHRVIIANLHQVQVHKI